MHSFSKSEALKFGWHTFKKNAGLLIGVQLFVYLVAILPQLLGDAFEFIWGEKLVLVFLVNAAVLVLSIFFNIGLVKIYLKLSSSEGASFQDIFYGFRAETPLFRSYIIGSILYSLIVIAGLILFIVPGIIWAIKFSFFAYLIVDKGMGPVEALKKSAELTAGAKKDLFLLGLLMILIQLGGILALVVGVLVAAPVNMLAYLYAYRRLGQT